jgi:3-oxoacyl-ACP reductase-like protein
MPAGITNEEDTMSIFGKIKDAIFGSAKAKEVAPASTESSSAAPASGAAPASTAAATPAAKTSAQAGPPPMSQVDVEAVLTGLAAKNKQKLDWRKSIVDLMKLLDLDSSLAARQELAKELGYTGNTSDSASMNIWLHKQVMKKLAASGGKVPDDLKT